MIKKKLKNVFKTSLVIGIIICLGGCGNSGANIGSKSNVEPVFAATSEGRFLEGDVDADNKDKVGYEANTADDNIPMMKLPKGINGIKAEKNANDELRKLIINFYEIPEEYWKDTRYYYNYVDLNEDGKKEIFVLVMGPYTSGTGGSSAMWVVESAGRLHVNQDLSIVNTPVVISNVTSNSMHEIVVPYCGGGIESQYSILKYCDGQYTRVSDSKTVKTLDGISGTAILANDIFAEMQAGIIGHNLLEE